MSKLEPARTCSNPTATDELLVTGYPNSLRPELHKALKARGIDYWVAQGITFWNRDDGCECLAYGYKVNGVPKLAIKVVGFTDPEQAIAATLGAGSCHDKNGFDRQVGFECTACGTMVDSYMVTPLDTGHEVQFRYCPFCGGKVVSE